MTNRPSRAGEGADPNQKSAGATSASRAGIPPGCCQPQWGSVDSGKAKGREINLRSFGEWRAGVGVIVHRLRPNPRCGIEAMVPFRPTQCRPVLCRSCFQK
jgi:CxxC-x17-CxxC domain-containing protein